MRRLWCVYTHCLAWRSRPLTWQGAWSPILWVPRLSAWGAAIVSGCTACPPPALQRKVRPSLTRKYRQCVHVAAPSNEMCVDVYASVRLRQRRRQGRRTQKKKGNAAETRSDSNGAPAAPPQPFSPPTTTPPRRLPRTSIPIDTAETPAAQRTDAGHKNTATTAYRIVGRTLDCVFFRCFTAIDFDFSLIDGEKVQDSNSSFSLWAWAISAFCCLELSHFHSLR